MTSPASIFESLLSSASDAIIATDRAGTISLWNPGATRIFGFTEVEAIGRSLDIIIPENQRKRHWDGYARTMETGQSRYGAGDLLAVPALTKDGRRISVEFTITMQFDAHARAAGTVAIVRDVSKNFDEKRELRRRLAALERSS
jgi:PAS domain S-box-containing protein